MFEASIVEKKRPAERHLGVEVLRYVLSAAVLVYHFFYYGPLAEGLPSELLGPNWLVFGRFAVACFFIVSGFVIAKSTENRTWSAFFKARVVRLAPAILFCSVLSFFLVYAAKGQIVEGGYLFVKTASLVGIVAGGRLIDGSYWSLIYEFRFYLLMALLVAIGLARRSLWVMLALTAVGVAASFVVGGQALSLLLFPHLVYFAIGICLNQIFYRQIRPLTGIVVLVVLLALAGYCTNVDYARVDALDGAVSPVFTGWVIALSATVFFWLALIWQVPSRFAALAKMLGSVSFPLYLLHQGIGYAGIEALAARNVPSVAAAVLMTVLIHAVALFVARNVEPYGTGLLRKGFGLARAQVSARRQADSTPGA